MNCFKEFWKRLTAPLAPDRPPLTPRDEQALVLARKEAQRLHHRFVDTGHVLLGLIRLGQGVAVNVTTAMGLDLEAARSQLEKQIPVGTHEAEAGPIDFTPKVKRVLALADEERRALTHNYLGTEHILLGLLREGEGVGGLVLKNLGIDIKATKEQILSELDPEYTSRETGGPVSS